MATVAREGRVEAKGYPVAGGGVQKSSKKLSLQVLNDGTVNFLDSGKVEYAVHLNYAIEAVLDAKKKRFNINLDGDISVQVDPDDDAAGWVDLLAKVTPQRYFGAEMSAVTKDQEEMPQLIEAALQSLQSHMDTEGIFRISGTKTDIDTLRRLYDSGQRPNNLLHYDVHVVTGLLKLYLRQLATPLVPFQHYERMLNLAASPDIASAVAPLIAEFPRQNQLVLKAICTFAHKVAAQSSMNQMTYTNLAIVIGPNLMRPTIESLESATHAQFIIPIFSNIFEHIEKVWPTPAGEKAKLPAAPSGPPVLPPTGLPPPPGGLPPPPTGLPPPMAGMPPPSAAPAPMPNSGLPSDTEPGTSRRPVSMMVGAGVKLPMMMIPPAGAKKALRPVGAPPAPADDSIRPAASMPVVTLPPPIASEGAPAPSNPAPYTPSHPSPAGAKKMPFMGQMQERQAKASAAQQGDSLQVQSASSPSLTRSPSAGSIPKPQKPLSREDSGASADGKADASKAEAPKEPEDPEVAQWKIYQHDDGRKYFHNIVTNVTQWEKPECLKKKKKTLKKSVSRDESETMSASAATTATPTAGTAASSDSTQAFTTSTTAATGTPSTTASKALKRKTDRAQTVATPNREPPKDALAGTEKTSAPVIPVPFGLPTPISAPAPAASSQSEAMRSPSSDSLTSSSKGSTDRVKALEDRVAALERLVAQQQQQIEQLLSR